MALKKIRKSASTMTTVAICLLIIMGIFFGSYLYFAENVENAGLTVDSKYADAYANLSESQADLEANVELVQTNLADIKEAESVIQQAWNGLKGLGNTLKLMINFIDTTQSAYQATVPTLDILPGWTFALIFVGLLAFIVFLVLRILKGEPAM